MSALTLASTLALASFLSVQTHVTTWLVFDPTADNRLELEVPEFAGGGVRESRLVGGVLARITFDLVPLLLNQPASADVVVEEIRVAGESFDALPGLGTGTLCVSLDPVDPGGGILELPVLAPPHITAELRTLTHLAGPIAALVPDGIPLAATIDEDLQIDLRALLANGLTAGPAAVNTSAEGIVPPNVIVFGGQAFRIEAKILNSLAVPEDPLLDECEAAGLL